MTRPTAPLTVTCLCAEWCGACREFRPLFDALAASVPAHRWVWVDVEDEADTVGDLDIETFPTLVVSGADTLLFAGPVLPRVADCQRLIESLEAGWRAGTPPPSARLPADMQRAYGAIAQAVQGRAA